MGSRLRTILAATLLVTATTAAAADPEWIKQFGTYEVDGATGIATGPDGRVHVVGDTYGHFGAYKGGHDAFVITFDRDGRELWRHQLGTAEDDGVTGVATDADGNVYVVGWTSEPRPGNSVGAGDVFLIKYGPNGPQ
ncbi:MAG: SBBP repeat-containing protein [Rhodospirillales bacterium]|nr:SBBP repeat-containing protein [Rhodospirillales bacterium]MBK8175993.1 SBBP repeat-containing protein [Rhodospirillales bacterium]